MLQSSPQLLANLRSRTKGTCCCSSSNSSNTMCGGIKSCCCCLSLRSGSLIAGSFLMTLNALNVVSLALRNFSLDVPDTVCYNRNIKVSMEDCREILKHGMTAMLVAALMDCIYVITCLLLFIGIFRRSEVLMLPFMSMTVVQTLRLAVITLGTVFAYYILDLNMVILINSSIIHLVVIIYLGVIVYNYYPRIMKSMFRDWYMEMKKRRDENLENEPFAKVPIAWIDLEKGALTRSDSYMTLETAKDEERAKICKDTLCILIPILVVGVAWAAKEFFLYQYL